MAHLMTALQEMLHASNAKDTIIEQQQAEITGLTERNRELEELLENETQRCADFHAQCNVFEKQRRAAIDQLMVVTQSSIAANSPATDHTPASVFKSTVVPRAQKATNGPLTDADATQPIKKSGTPSSPGILVNGNDIVMQDTAMDDEESTVDQEAKQEKVADKRGRPEEDPAEHEEDTVQVAALRPSKKARQETPADASESTPTTTLANTGEVRRAGRKSVLERLTENILNHPRWGQEAWNHVFFQETLSGEWSDAKRRALQALVIKCDIDFTQTLNAMFRAMLQRIAKGGRPTPYVETGDINAVTALLQRKNSFNGEPITSEEMQNAAIELRKANKRRIANPALDISFDNDSGSVVFSNLLPLKHYLPRVLNCKATSDGQIDTASVDGGQHEGSESSVTSTS